MPRQKNYRRVKVGDWWGSMKCFQIYQTCKEPFSEDGNRPARVFVLHCAGYHDGFKECMATFDMAERNFPGKVSMPDCGCGHSGMVLLEGDDRFRERIMVTWNLRIDHELYKSIENWAFHSGNKTTLAKAMRELLVEGLDYTGHTIDMRLVPKWGQGGKYAAALTMDDQLAGRVIKWADKFGLRKSTAAVLLLKLGLNKYGQLGKTKEESIARLGVKR